MEFFETAIVVVHLLVSLALIGLILLQQGKGADAGASFGAGASQTVFGSQGSGSFLTHATKWLAVVFFVTSISLAVVAKQKAAVAVGDELISVPEEAVVAPADAEAVKPESAAVAGTEAAPVAGAEAAATDAAPAAQEAAAPAEAAKEPAKLELE